MLNSNYTEDKLGPLVPMPEELLHYCDGLKNYNITAMAGILFYITLVENVKKVLEIGTGWCLSTIAFASALKINNGNILSFDIHNRENLLSKVPEVRKYITQINCNSHNFTQTDNIIKSNGFELVDLLFIDGDHTYEGVKQDFNNYIKYLNPRGIIILHDIALISKNKGKDSIEVYKFWNEIDENTYNKFPFFASNGLGLIRKKF